MLFIHTIAPTLHGYGLDSADPPIQYLPWVHQLHLALDQHSTSIHDGQQADRKTITNQ